MNSTDPNATPATQSLPDAFIYLAGLGQDLIDQSGAGIAKRLAREFDRRAQSDKTKFFVDPQTREETFSGDQEKPLKIKVSSLNRKDSDGQRKVIDLYELDYRPILTKYYLDQYIPRKAFRLLWVILPNIFRFLKALSFRRTGKNTSEKLQFIFAAGILALSLVYFISLGLALYQTLSPTPKSGAPGGTAPGQSTIAVPLPQSTSTGKPEPAATTQLQPPAGAPAPAAPAVPTGEETDACRPSGNLATPADPKGATAAPKDASPSPTALPAVTEPEKKPAPPVPASTSPTLPVAIVILIAVFELFFPGFKQCWNSVAAEYLAAMEYLDQGTRKAVISGQLTDLLDYLTRTQEYRQIHLLSYSFGTVVALDTIFPSGGQPGARFAKLHTFITIGCPFDLIRLFWPQYFDNRYALSETPRHWLNIYNRRDILASNFRNDDQEKDAEIKLIFTPELNVAPCGPKNIPYRVSTEPEKITFLNSLNPLNLRTHSSYWEPTAFESELTCFSAIIKEIYGNDALLT